MGLLGRIRDIGRKAVNWIKDKLGFSSYSHSSIADQIDVDKVLSEFRETIQEDVSLAEKKCMYSVLTLFEGLKDKTSERFPDLVEIIELEQKNAENELAGTVMQYVKEHISKNDEKFLSILKMQPGPAKADALKLKQMSVIEDAEKYFNKKLKKYAERILNEFTNRLNTRIDSQSEHMEKRIEEMKKLEDEAIRGSIDVEALKDSCAPVMEAAESILYMLGMEMN